MKDQSRVSLVVGAVIPLVLFVSLLAYSLAGKISTTASAQTQPTSTTKDGLQTVTFDTPSARVTVKLPDDIRMGDTISGTLAVEPKGSTTDEQAKNRTALRTRMIRLMLTRVRKPGEAPVTNPVILTVPLSGGDTSTVKTLRGRGNETRIEFMATAPGDFALAPEVYKMAEAEIGSAAIPIDTTTDAAPMADPKLAPKFTVPPLGQTGRPVVVIGPFDGKSSNTDVKLTTPPKPIIKISTREDGIDLPVIAESPRKAVIEFPSDVLGSSRITVTDGRTQTSAPFRNVGVDLTAPKTNLLKGEKTTLTVHVSGLEGINAPVPMNLTCSGVITMQGGAYQPLMIQPSQVGPGGTYATTREITGVQAGGWGATATVMTHRFDACLQDDNAPGSRILWNTFTGDYIFINPLPPPKPPVQPPPTNLTGTGTITMKGCIFTLEHNAPDRRVMGRLDACTNSGNASVQVYTPKVKFTIIDRNTADNTSSCK